MAELKAAFQRAKPKYYPTRQRFTLPVKEGQRRGEVLRDGSMLAEYGLQDGSVLLFKDLGPQVRRWAACGGAEHGHGQSDWWAPPCCTWSVLCVSQGMYTAWPPSCSCSAIVQIGYRTVFLWEYLGPLVVYALFYYFPNTFYFWYKYVFMWWGELRRGRGDGRGGAMGAFHEM